MKIDNELESILNEITTQDWNKKTWAAHESGDWFQSKHYRGGFEADETYEDGEFNFSYYDENDKEWWFTFSLDDVSKLYKKEIEIELINPDTFDINQI
ncbi:MAG: hypothetical protein GY869_09105 [Planctomycetes bacterium]|nr:hypothetical protein [Planctomycetota bacterium]